MFPEALKGQIGANLKRECFRTGVPKLFPLAYPFEKLAHPCTPKKSLVICMHNVAYVMSHNYWH